MYWFLQEFIEEAYEERQVIEADVIDNLPSVKKLAQLYLHDLNDKPKSVQLNKPKVSHNSLFYLFARDNFDKNDKREMFISLVNCQFSLSIEKINIAFLYFMKLRNPMEILIIYFCFFFFLLFLFSIVLKNKSENSFKKGI